MSNQDRLENRRPDIVFLNEADLPAVAALEKACFSRTWTLEQLQASFKGGGLLLVGAKCDDGLLGYVSIQVFAPEMEIMNIAVIPARRGQGLGRDLARNALQLGFARGARKCFLEVAIDNTPAVNLYRSLGFAATGTRSGYYQESGQSVDAVVMERELRTFP